MPASPWKAEPRATSGVLLEYGDQTLGLHAVYFVIVLRI